MNTKMINGVYDSFAGEMVIEGKKGGVRSKENLINRKD